MTLSAAAVEALLSHEHDSAAPVGMGDAESEDYGLTCGPAEGSDGLQWSMWDYSETMATVSL